MTSTEIRDQFLKFFEKKEHKLVPGAPVVPFDDPTLLFTNAGMIQFKDVFLGKGTREYSRAADTQKCIRVSGKHNDLEEVGYDTYHHTFFEMLGNWSFGDYYKKEAIGWAWELLTGVWKLPKERLWATIHNDDDESYSLWKSETDIDPKHILRFGEKDNFWEMGETGPCGPCSEIHINTGDDYDNPKWVNAGAPECIELWNLVFIQYDKDEKGNLHDLPMKHIDTGMGFERMCAVLQNKKSNYDTDVFSPLIEQVVKLSGIKNDSEENKIPMRVIADHIRTLTFAIADGAVPGNEGRGYVLRRILRRAARYGRKLNLNDPFLYKLVDTLVNTMGDVFPEIRDKKNYVKKIIKAEEESFNATLDRGIELFGEIINQLEREKTKEIAGNEVFKLYDTYGFPADLTNVMAQEKGFTIDEEGFNKLMTEQKDRARNASKDKLSSINISLKDLTSFDLSDDKATAFTGYDEFKSKAKITGHKNERDTDLIILDRSPFYVEAGGQVDDIGKIQVDADLLDVVDVTRIENKTIHIVQNATEGIIAAGKTVIAEIDELRRWDIMRNHTATHFLHAALRKVLGTHVHQAGSYVGPDHLRFDFTHFAKLAAEEIRDIEALVNDELRRNYALQHHRDIPFDKAKKMGALMFFGDKYGDKVNVVQYGDFTMEFCGGTHVKNSSEIGLFKIVSESSIASGVRRIEAVTGAGVEKYIKNQLSIVKQSNERIEELFDVKKKLEKEMAELKMKDKLGQLDHILALSSKVKNIKIYKGKVIADNIDELKSFGDVLREKMESGVGVLVAQIDDKVGIVTVVSDDLIKEKKLNAGKIVGMLAKLIGGGGGGRAHLATAGGKNIEQIPAAIGKVEEVVSSLI
ncbi:MAG: alanine--tRNA ligase [Bacteroidetes bacterium]|nr:alanine--tRNA ligase [Bacteroidota bacterium]